MKKSAKPKSTSIKSIKSEALLEKTEKIKSIIVALMLIVFGMILGAILVVILIEKKSESINKKFAETAATNANKNPSQKYPNAAAINFPSAILSVSGSVEAVSESEIKIKTSVCQGEKEFTGKLTEKTEIIRRERQGNSPFMKDAKANISEIKKDDRVVLEAHEDISEKTTFEAKRIVIEKSLAIPVISPQ